ncbi:MAG: hypothetical protein WCA85_25895 [Paraburkholderia sp.]|uniref:hypothetical protein n=1 Tax=Paraburkholderia sp. TaxID=1926495 RepID=UPI003C3686BB
MRRDLFNVAPDKWREQSELAQMIGQTRKKAEKYQLVSLLCASLARMTEKPRLRR